jgi:DNA polymerase-4
LKTDSRPENFPGGTGLPNNLDTTSNGEFVPVLLSPANREANSLAHASAGVAPNKFLAKIASGWKKPDGLTVIAPERVESFLQKLPVEALWGVGPVTAKKLHAIGVVGLVDVRTADRALLTRTVGSLAEWLVRLSHGDDPRNVTPDRPWKSISAEDTYPEDLTDVKEMRAEIERLARRVAGSLEKKGLLARTVTIKVRYANFTTVTRSHTDEIPTSDARLVVERALALLERTDAPKRPVRLLGVGVHGLSGVDAARATPESLSLQEDLVL